MSILLRFILVKLQCEKLWYRPYLVLVLLGTYLAHTTEVDYRGPMHVDLSFLFKLVKDILHKLGKCRNGLFVLILLKIKRLLQVTRFTKIKVDMYSRAF